MIAIKKILVPTDFSDSSVPAIAYALSLAKKHAAEVGVLHVLRGKAIKDDFAHGYVTEGLITPGVLNGPPDLDTILERRQRIVRDFLEQKIGSDLLRSIRISALIRFGKPVKEIMAAAKEEQWDLIVMSRRSGLTLRGHVTDQIVRRAPCPVISIPPSAEVRTEENERVLLKLMDKGAA